MAATQMPADAKIFVAGHQGLVGSAITNRLCKSGYDNLLLRNRTELDLTSGDAVAQFFDIEKPQYVFPGGVHSRQSSHANQCNRCSVSQRYFEITVSWLIVHLS